MSLVWVLVIILLVVAIAGNPSFGYAANWGPSGVVGTILVILLILLLLGKI